MAPQHYRQRKSILAGLSAASFFVVFICGTKVVPGLLCTWIGVSLLRGTVLRPGIRTAAKANHAHA